MRTAAVVVLGAGALQISACEGLALFAPDDPVSVDDVQAESWTEMAAECRSIQRVGGVVLGEQRLTAGGCYLVEEDVVIAGKLTIESGTYVGVAPGRSVEIAEDGTLCAEGKEGSPVTVLGVASTSASWRGILVDSGGQLSLQHVVMGGAGAQTHATTAVPGGVYLRDGSWAELSNVLLHHGSGHGAVVERGAELLTRGFMVDGSFLGETSDIEPDADTSCMQGETQCRGSEMVFCIGEAWQVVRDCSDNVDSDKTMCGTFDGVAQCEEPFSGACREADRQLRDGLIDAQWHPNDACRAPYVCENVPLVGCMQPNVSSVPLVYEGNGNRRIRLELADDLDRDLENVVSGIRAELESEGQYEVGVYVNFLGGCEEPLRTAVVDDKSGTAELLYVWRTPRISQLNAIADSLRGLGRRGYWLVLEVRHLGEDCQDPWTLSVEPNPCPSRERPQDGHCPQ